MNCIAPAGLGLLLLTLVQAGGDGNSGGGGAVDRTGGEPATREAPGMTRLTDFDQAPANARWRMVNDNVMGGKSKGGVRFAEGVMTFSGDINTNGGGFSSVRLPIERGTLEGAKRIVMRLKHDGRVPYRLLVIDDAGRPR